LPLPSLLTREVIYFFCVEHALLLAQPALIR
jgi:hypothetical protein